MRILLRTFAVIVFAALLGAALAGTASAATVKVLAGVKGAGRISTPMTATRPELSCELQPPASDSTLNSCSTTEWNVTDPASASMTITAVPAPVWKFAGFDGCPGTVSGSSCILTATASATGYTFLIARFTAVTPPAPLDGLGSSQSTIDESVIDVSWNMSENGSSSRCTIDNSPAIRCD